MPLTPNQKKEVRKILADYCARAENNREKIHYRQFRPMNHLGKSPEAGFTCDCSAFVTGAFYWADVRTKFKVHDPNGLNFSRYGYTGTLIAANTHGRVPFDRVFMVGDMGFYGPSLSNSKHVVICRKGGHLKDAIWTSHGQESAPYPVSLDYRGDLLVVLRAEDLK